MIRSIAFAAALAWAPVAAAAPVILPGLSYEVQGSGPATGPHPTRDDSVTMRYVGRLADGAVFSTSPDDGKGLSTFAVKAVIPGMSAALQLMRPGDRWRVTMPSYLAYGPGRPLSAASSAQTVQKQAIPPNATLVFDVELVSIVAPKAP
jgi:FKBP-type peptidyl-prolyl cis-trans isomerase